jgi:RNA polymerase sigma-70 factor (ECF subfamily)
LTPHEVARLIECHAAALELFARQWCDDPADVVQAAFVRLMDHDDAPQRPLAWLFGAVRNTARMQRRSELYTDESLLERMVLVLV